MRAPRRRLQSPVIALLLLSFACGSSRAVLRSGVGMRIVTPDPLLPVSGGVGPSHPTTRAEGDLTVRALVLEEAREGATNRVAIVSGDFLGFPSQLGDRVRRKVTGAIPPENILIGATHTHSAPDCYGFPDGKGGYSSDARYLGVVCLQMEEAIREAIRTLQPSELKIATGEARGKIAYNYYAEQLYDPRCHVIQTLSTNGRVIGTLVNYAVHPEVIGSNQGIVSPDLVGPLCRALEREAGGQAMFMNSAQGGMVTADCRGPNGKDIRTWEECVRIGELLASESLRIVKTAPVLRNPHLFCAARKITFPVESPLLQAVLKSSPLGFSGEDDSKVTTQMNLINLGPAQILTIPGEALPNIGFYLKRKMKGEQNLLFGLTNDAFGYMLTKVDFNSFKRYEYVSRTSLGEMTGEILMDEALRFVKESPAPEK